MARNSIDIERLPLLPPANRHEESVDLVNGYGPKRDYLDVEVFYDKGENIFGGNSVRGYYLKVAPITTQDSFRDGRKSGEIHGFMLFSGNKMLLMPAKRFSEKALAAAAEMAKTDPRVAGMKAHVLEKNSLVLA